MDVYDYFISMYKAEKNRTHVDTNSIRGRAEMAIDVQDECVEPVTFGKFDIYYMSM